MGEATACKASGSRAMTALKAIMVVNMGGWDAV